MISTQEALTSTHEFQRGDGLQYHCVVESQLGKVQSHFIAEEYPRVEEQEQVAHCYGCTDEGYRVEREKEMMHDTLEHR